MTAANDATSWVPMAGGLLALGHRPKKAAIQMLGEGGATTLVTLLSQREGARDLGVLAMAGGVRWIWLPLPNGAPPPLERDDDIRSGFAQIAAALAAGGRVLVHCSAGIHRTGMMAFGLLRFLGLSPAEAKGALALLRQVTADGVGEERLAWGEAFVDRLSRCV